jgi:hypothetical protein
MLCQSSRMAAESPRLAACGDRKRERIAAETDGRTNSQAQCLRAVGRQRAELRGRRRGRLESVNEICASLAVVVTKTGREHARMRNSDKHCGYHDTERKGDSAAGRQRRPRSTKGLLSELASERDGRLLHGPVIGSGCFWHSSCPAVPPRACAPASPYILWSPFYI